MELLATTTQVASTGLLQRIDPATNAVVADVDLADRFVSAITAAGSNVWAITIGSAGGVLVRVDQRATEIVAEIPLGFEFAGYEDQVLAGGGSIWALGVTWNQERDIEYGSDLVRVDPETNTISERIAVGGFQMAVSPESVWVRFPLDGAFDGGDERWRWTTVDYSTNEPSASFEFDAGLRLVTEDDVWTVGDAAHDYARVSRYDVQSLELASRGSSGGSPIRSGTASPCGPSRAAGRPSSWATAARRSRSWTEKSTSSWVGRSRLGARARGSRLRRARPGATNAWVR